MTCSTPLLALAVTAEHFSVLLSGGATPQQALNVTAAKVRPSALRRALDAAGDDATRGIPLGDALAQHPDVFPEPFVDAARAAHPAQNLAAVARTYRAADRARRTEQRTRAHMQRSVAFFALGALTSGLGMLAALSRPRA